MPDDYQQPHDPFSRRPRRRRETDETEKDETLALPVYVSDASDAPDAGDASLGQFSLLADPTTISGGSQTTSQNESNQDEVGRLRSALYARSREIVALQRDQTTPTDPELPESSVEYSEPLRGVDDAERVERVEQSDVQLLNSAQARQLADDAHVRERAIRTELSTARNALRSESPETPKSATNSEEPKQQWRTRALVGGPTRSEWDPIRSTSDTSSFGTTEIVLRTEMRELQATLSIARDTTLSQKKKIAALRIQLAEKDQLLEDALHGNRESQIVESQAVAPEPLTSIEAMPQQRVDNTESEMTRLRDRLRQNGRETDARDAERALLMQTLEEREDDLSIRRTQLEELQDRFDVQGRSLDHARAQFDQERTRNTASRELFSQLRQTLGDESTEHPSELLDAAPQRQPAAESALAPGHRQEQNDPSFEFRSEGVTPSVIPAEAREADAFNAIHEDCDFSRPAIFDAWQDDQIRRHFGPMGIDTIIDLLRAPLARRTDHGRSETPLVLIGRGAWKWAAMLADGLVLNGMPAFLIYVCDPAGEGMSPADGLGHERPIRDFLRNLSFPDSPESLRASLEEIDPAALVSRDFLSTEADVEPWLEVLDSASTNGTCLLFSERTGVGPASAPPEVSLIGDRIWELMPGRYTRLANLSTRYATWSEAFAKSQQEIEKVPANDLLSRLRNRFRLEMLARFGFLAESFVATPIGENFDAKATRDRKFLSQVADVDDRKIEAGIVPALHLVAVVDREADAEIEVEHEG